MFHGIYIKISYYNDNCCIYNKILVHTTRHHITPRCNEGIVIRDSVPFQFQRRFNDHALDEDTTGTRLQNTRSTFHDSDPKHVSGPRNLRRIQFEESYQPPPPKHPPKTALSHRRTERTRAHTHAHTRLLALVVRIYTSLRARRCVLLLACFTCVRTIGPVGAAVRRGETSRRLLGGSRRPRRRFSR